MSTQEQNREIARRYAEVVWGEGNVEVMDELLTEDQVYHDPTRSGEEHLDEFKGFIQMYHATFPDLRFEVSETIAEGDKVCFLGQIQGTHEGEFMGIEPTGNQIDIMVINVVRIENGKIAERWANVDIYGMLQQLGIDPLQTTNNHEQEEQS